LFAQESVTEDQAKIGITDQNFDTDVSIEILKGMGVYQERSLTQSDPPEGGVLRTRRQYVSHRLTSGSQVEFTSQQLTSMLSENHYRRTQERLNRKVLDIVMEKLCLCRGAHNNAPFSIETPGSNTE
jgi:hypothetical protein